MKPFQDRRIVSVCVNASEVFQILDRLGLLTFDDESTPAHRRISRLPDDLRILRVDLSTDYDQEIVFHCESDQLAGYEPAGRQLRVKVRTPEAADQKP